MKKRSNHSSKDITRLAEAGAAYLMEVAKMAEQVAIRLHRDQGDGFPARTGDGGGRAAHNDDGSISGPTPNLALHKDPMELLANRLMRALTNAEIEARTAVVAARAARGLDAEVARQLSEAEAPNGSNCVNCDEWVPGVGEYRIRAGRCDTCYRHRLRHDGVDRVIVVEVDE